MRRKIVAGNWKMNGSEDLVRNLVNDVSNGMASLENCVEVVIIPPALYVRDVLSLVGQRDVAVATGVQNVAPWDAGAYTGEISAAMAADVGCRYALVGHSERRQLFGETDELVAEKVRKVLASGLAVIVCVGETLEEREQGVAERVVARQVRAALAEVESADWPKVIVAYEPVWAIGTGKTATAADAQAMHQAIRKELSGLGAPESDVSVLYGGSVKPDNAAELFAQPDIDGGLIGGASLIADDFLGICQAARDAVAGTDA